ncbi:MAG: sigma-54-dependent Fis family transcriptional regulator [Candidatus Tectomicrobia bacterium]|uniref:Sigma-54-dependent Fis family transcriptional regulator n=1 Tax=Tectimicrobiota bacterium TaxID=2528274 RepID=A0A932FVG2_UNCTE|nr:sigma-54-dependent Fis family transcriptional regulator [Candidatus Tectomicrobia bacterium]
MRRSLSVLVVDDDAEMRSFLKTLLTLRWDHRVTMARGGIEALELLKDELQPDLILLDICMPGMGGLEVLRQLDGLKEPAGGPSVVILSGVEEIKTVVEAMRLGAVDYLKKPFEEEELEIAIHRAMSQKEILEEVQNLREQIRARDEVIPLGNSPAMERVTKLVEQVADTDATVLLQGESGVGKEVVAHFLHQKSSRRRGPFVKLNCAALPPNLLESELFGYERGAFTGAQRQKPGRFELAHKGTIFLDEIGEADLMVQAKLLQVIEHGKFTRLGGKRDMEVDVRIIAATNLNLEAAVRTGSFRGDLYYRINVIGIVIPPLRERRDDIPALCQYFLETYNARYGRKRKGISKELMRLLMQYGWPGNVRELENVVKRVVALDGEEMVTQELLQTVGKTVREKADFIPLDLSGREGLSLKEIGQQAASRAEREAILAVLARTNWNRQRAAQILGVSSRTLFAKIKEYNLK